MKIEREDIIIEPSAGAGAFIPLIKSLTDKYYFIDIAPDHPEVKEADFLKVKINIKNKERKVHIIGKPPFRLAVKFIKKCSNFANSISFILPISFMKEFRKKSIPLNFHLVEEAEIPEGAFGKIKTVFQIWKKEKFDRVPPAVLEPIGYKFVKAEEADIAIGRRGTKQAGRIISKKLLEKNKEDNYFVNFDIPVNLQ